MSDQAKVFTGFWVNWEEGYGSTITLSSSNGAYLVAFLALFVAVTGSGMWSIIRFVLFRHLSSPKPTDGLHHQRQAVLRGSFNEVSTVTMLWQIWIAWKGTANSPLRRLLGAAVVALLNLLLFAVAGIFSSRVTSSRSEVLLAPDISQCGLWDSTRNLMSDNWQLADLRTTDAGLRKAGLRASRIASSCYNGTVTTTSNLCPVSGRRLIPWTLTKDADCPFDTSICGLSGSVKLDSGLIDSSAHLGINSQPVYRVQCRLESTCNVLNITDFLNQTDTPVDPQFPEVSGTRIYRGLYLGTSALFDGQERLTFEISSSKTGSEANVKGLANLMGLPGYFVDVETASFQGGNLLRTSGLAVKSSFDPVPELRLGDGKLSLLILVNRQRYESKVDDPWFAATDAEQIGDITYYSKQSVQAIGCATRKYFCLPPRPGVQSRCEEIPPAFDLRELQSYINNKTQDMHPQQAAILARTMPAASNAFDYYNTFIDKGSDALLAKEDAATQETVAPQKEQWIRELQNIFSTGLLKFSILSQDWVTDSTGSGLTRAAPSKDEEWMCHNQVVPSEAFASFSVIGLGVILGTGLAIMITAWYIEQIVCWFDRRNNKPSAVMADWRTMGIFQLQRLAYDARNLGTWTGTETVPTTQTDDRFGLPEWEGHAKSGSAEHKLLERSDLDAESSHYSLQELQQLTANDHSQGQSGFDTR